MQILIVNNISGRKKNMFWAKGDILNHLKHIVKMALNKIPAVFTVNIHKHSDNRHNIDQHKPVPGNSFITMHSDR